MDSGTNATEENEIRDKLLHASSALLTTTMPEMGVVIGALDEAGLRERVKVVIGGAPVTEDYAEKIGADGYAADASRAIKLVKSLLS